RAALALRALSAPNGTRRRVVVTGLGLVTPLGIGIEANWESLVAGRSGIGPITRFDASALPARVAAEGRYCEPGRFIERKELKKMDIFIQYTVGAAELAVEDAGLPLPLAAPERTGVIVGVGMGGISSVEEMYLSLAAHTVRRVSPFLIPRIIPNMASGQIAIRYGARGPNYATTSACASGAPPIGRARGRGRGRVHAPRPRRRRHRARRDRLHQRARHRHAVQRRGRDARREARLRRARGAAPDQLDQVDDRAPARRGGHDRGGLHRA